MKRTLYILMLLLLPLMGNAITQETQKISDKVKQLYAPDSRQALWEVDVFRSDSGVVVKGKTTEQEAYVYFRKMMAEKGYEFIDSVYVYPGNKWGMIRISVASLRSGAKHASEIVTQALMGTPVRMLEHKGEWWRIQSPDGYISYVPESSLVIKSPKEMQLWRKSNRLIVTALDQIRVYSSPNTSSPRDMVTDLVNGCIVEYKSESGDKIEVKLPDGRLGWIDAAAVESVENWASQKFNADKILETAYSLMGTPYLWGGMSTKALDCSGLARVCYFANGIILMRDASQQAKTGMRIEAEDWQTCQAGDLLYFGNAKTKRVTHVAIYDKDGEYVHSSGRVKVNSVNPESKGYLKTPFLHAIRVNGCIGTDGITSVRNHPWYF